jgi:hypothetical protein
MSLDSRQIEILTRCKEDFFYFFENFMLMPQHYAYSPGPPPNEVYGYQRRLIEQMQNKQVVVGHKFRAGGFTSIVSSYLLWIGMFQSDKHMMMCHPTDRHAVTAMSSLKSMANHIPDWMQPRYSKSYDHHLKFEGTESNIWSLRYQPSCGRTLDYVFFDEVETDDDIEHTWNCLFPCITTGGSCLILGSPHTIDRPGDRWFRKTWKKATIGFYGMASYKATCLEHPLFSTSEWMDKTRSALGDKIFATEYLGEWPMSDDVRPVKLRSTVRLCWNHLGQKPPILDEDAFAAQLEDGYWADVSWWAGEDGTGEYTVRRAKEAEDWSDDKSILYRGPDLDEAIKAIERIAG